MLESGVFGLYILQFLLFVVGFWGYNRLSQLLADSQGRLNDLATSHGIELDPILEKMEATISEIVDDTLQNLEPPKAIDHLFGAVAQMIQMRTMSSLNLMPEQLEQPIESLENV
jgi:hypothetical protein